MGETKPNHPTASFELPGWMGRAALLGLAIGVVVGWIGIAS